MITRINESKTLIKYISCDFRCKFDGEKCNSKQKLNSDKGRYVFKKLIKHQRCKQDYVLTPSICACECNKKCGVDEYLKSCTCIKSLIYNLVITCDEIVNTSGTASIDSFDNIGNIENGLFYSFYYPISNHVFIIVNSHCY